VRWRWLRPRALFASSATPSVVLTGMDSSILCKPRFSLYRVAPGAPIGALLSPNEAGLEPRAAQAGRMCEEADAYFAPMSRAPKSGNAPGRKTTTATQTFTDAQSALDHATLLYDDAVRRLRKALQGFISGRQFHSRVRECYPNVRVHTQTVARADSRLSYGFVA